MLNSQLFKPNGDNSILPRVVPKPYPRELDAAVTKVLNQDAEHEGFEYMIQRWGYSGSLDLNGFFDQFGDQSRIVELLGSPVKFSMNIESRIADWSLYNFRQDLFYWDNDGHCLKDLFRFQYSEAAESFPGYGPEFPYWVRYFKQLLEIDDDDAVTYYSTLFLGIDPPNVGPDYYKTGVDFSQLHNLPYPPEANKWRNNFELCKHGCPWFINEEIEHFDGDPGRCDVSVFQNHTKQEIILLFFRDSDYIWT